MSTGRSAKAAYQDSMIKENDPGHLKSKDILIGLLELSASMTWNELLPSTGVTTLPKIQSPGNTTD